MVEEETTAGTENVGEYTTPVERCMLGMNLTRSENVGTNDSPIAIVTGGDASVT